MNRLFSIFLALVLSLPVLLSSGVALAVEKSWTTNQDPSVFRDPSAMQSPTEIQEPLSDHPLTKEERKKLREEKEKKAFEEKKKNLPPIKMVYVKGGCFDMGDWTGTGDDDETPVHEVCLSDYYIAEAEITNGLWQYVMDWADKPGLDPDVALVNVTWPWANSFIEKLNKLTDGFYRLPTEAEWEYAARERGKKIKWSGTNNDENIEDYSWMLYNSDHKIHKVKTKRPNALGLYDMTGNAREWVEDNFDFDYYKVSNQNDPYGPDYSNWRTVRGGSAISPPQKLRTTFRNAQEPNLRSPMTGFRLAE